MPRTDIASRAMDAPPDVVYRALVDEAALVEWLPPAGMSALVELRADDVPAGISADDHATGMCSSLEQLAAFVSR